MSGVKIALVGGDLREIFLAKFLLSQGWDLCLCGFDQFPNPPIPNTSDLHLAVDGAQAVILPLSGTTEQFTPKCKYSQHPPLLNQEFFSALDPGTVVFVGWARPLMKEYADRAGVKLVEIAEDDELAILNSIPTAEGAVAIAMEETDITIHGNNALVTGFGRCAISLARMLAGIGARVTVVARKTSDLARAHEMGFAGCTFKELPEIISSQEFVFNTVPILILDKEILMNAQRCKIVVDIASGRGGTDFDAAEALGITAVLAPGLPGIVAPISAGEILTKVYPRLLAENGLMGRSRG